MTFSQTGLKPEVLQALEGLGFTEPTPIQAQAIPALLEEGPKDLLALAQTGTGKTAAFGLPVIHYAKPELPRVQTLILSPTRELALQIARDLERFSLNIPGLSVAAIYGGAGIVAQIRALRAGAQIVVGTPGRVIDLMGRGALDVSALEFLVLDEADEMLNMGFKDDLDVILGQTPASRTTLLFSATMPNDIARIAATYMKDPQTIKTGQEGASKGLKGAETVRHEYMVARARDRYAALRRFLDFHPDIYGIVFCRTKRETQEVCDHLVRDGYDAESLHGDHSQIQRDQTMARFRSGRLQILAATDVAARGLDVNELTHVINYQLPDDPETYVHRSGRTGRAGKDGVCVSIIHSKEFGRLRAIERGMGRPIMRIPIPVGKDIIVARMDAMVESLAKPLEISPDIELMLSDFESRLESLDRRTLIARLAQEELGRLQHHYADSEDLNVQEGDSKARGRNQRGSSDRTSRGRRGDRPFESPRENRNSTFQGFTMPLGAADGLTPARIIGILNNCFPQDRVEVGKIRISNGSSYLEVDQQFARDLPKAMATMQIQGQPILVQKTSSDQSGAKQPRRSKKQKSWNDRPYPSKGRKSAKPGRKDSFNMNREQRAG
ncbi:DEAD/DEAH box helicase [Spirochaeta lutea]|uniref:DEAD/DEAH box helicase n=1 Tax=Spirochaeta lutea TaxID=1480694 RepID=UPI00068E87B0|nr:DEAD/DEAH box helicase [Spirochaeta lutea]